METLRVYGPLHGFPRWTGNTLQSLPVGERNIILPPKTTVMVNNGATQTNPAIWGDDADMWRPNRWISSVNEPGKEALLTIPTKDAFLAWSSGPRVCPGLKFSQVEFVAVMAEWLRSHLVEPVLEGKEGMDYARKRLKASLRTHTCSDCSGPASGKAKGQMGS